MPRASGLIQSSARERKITQLRQSYVTGHLKKLRSLVFNPTTPNLLATCALDGFVKVWNLASAHSYSFSLHLASLQDLRSCLPEPTSMLHESLN